MKSAHELVPEKRLDLKLGPSRRMNITKSGWWGGLVGYIFDWLGMMSRTRLETESQLREIQRDRGGRAGACELYPKYNLI
jgi:hypothetical protein